MKSAFVMPPPLCLLALSGCSATTAYGRGLAYAIFVPEDTLRTKSECAQPQP